MVRLGEQIKEIVLLDKPNFDETTGDDIFIIKYKKGLMPGKKKNKVLIGKRSDDIVKKKQGKDFMKKSYYEIKDMRDGYNDTMYLPLDYKQRYKYNVVKDAKLE